MRGTCRKFCVDFSIAALAPRLSPVWKPMWHCAAMSPLFQGSLARPAELQLSSLFPSQQKGAWSPVNMSQEHPMCQRLWWKDISVPTRVRVLLHLCTRFCYSSWIFCLLTWLPPPVNCEICEDNALLMFYPHSLVYCLSDKCRLNGWII